MLLDPWRVEEADDDLGPAQAFVIGVCAGTVLWIAIAAIVLLIRWLA
jgi:hypothetical protein